MKEVQSAQAPKKGMLQKIAYSKVMRRTFLTVSGLSVVFMSFGSPKTANSTEKVNDSDAVVNALKGTAPLLETKQTAMDSLKAKIVQKDNEIQIIENGIVVSKMKHDKNDNVRAFTQDGKPTKKQGVTMTDDFYGVRIVNADVFFGSFRDSSGYYLGPNMQYSAVRDTVLTFQNGLADTVKCNWPGHPTWSENDRMITKRYLFTNVIPRGVYGDPAIVQYLWNMIGDPESGVFLSYSPPLQNYGDITKWVVTYKFYVNQNGEINFPNALPRTINAQGIYDEDMTNGTNPERTNSYLSSITGIYTIQGNQLCTYYGVTIGWYNAALAPIHQSIIAYLTVGITPISNEIPAKYSISQNFPNPFNPTTKIKFGVPKAGIVSIKVYDILGKEVATIVDKKMEPGTYEASLNAANLSSGVYFYRMVAGDFAESKRMLLVK